MNSRETSGAGGASNDEKRTHKIFDLGKKVAFLMGECEFIRIRQLVQQKSRSQKEATQKQISDATKQLSIAAHLSVHATRWTRMKQGKESITSLHLGQLSEYFDVDRYCEISIWTKPYEEFALVLTTLGYGRLRYRASAPGLKDVLCKLAESDNQGLRIVIVSGPSLSRRGIGAIDAGNLPTPELRPGDEVQIAVSPMPDFEYFFLLSEDPNKRLTLLAPATAGMNVRISGDEIILPSETGTYPVGRPFGSHALYAVFTRKAIGLDDHISFAAPFPVLKDREEDGLRDDLAGRGAEDAKALCLPYEVVR
jgi:hypothetical protein